MQTTVIFKADKRRKQEAQRLAKKMGIPFSAVMNQLIADFIAGKQITFSEESYAPTPYLERLLIQGEKDLKTGKNIDHFNSIEELFADLEN